MARRLEVRKLHFDFSRVPRVWCDDDPRMTHVVNGLSAVFPAGERFFMRSVAAFEDRLDDKQRETLRAFYGQEANHGRAHQASFEMLERQGYELRSWLGWYERHAYGEGVESLAPANLRLATTVALEHLTATLAEVAFDPDEVVARMDPAMRQLLRWHAAEEIEHKAVAFDVLTHVDPRLRLRILGLIMGLALLGFYAGSAANHLARQDGLRGVRLRMVAEFLRRPAVLRSTLAYLRRDFHPDERNNYGLAEEFLRGLEPSLDQS